MKSSYKKPLIYFAVLTVLLAAIFFLLPINLFDGVVVEKVGLVEIEHERPISLSYFIGMGYDTGDMDRIADFYLKPKGMVMAVLFICGFPAMFAYRLYLRSTKE
jgi:hypothetical protein